ncbi:MAG: BatA domain-containing protein [Planctomycetota bacterium]|nr:BatA domain-containing protein [Planctomycetota bacterium]
MFANPVFLWGLMAAGVPILVHLIFRRKRLAVDYPTLMFLHRVDMKLASRRKVKEILLLVLRVLAVTLVVLALARPGFHAKGAGGGSADCVVIIDNSASMGLLAPAGTRLELARGQAATIVSGLGAEGRAAVIPTVPGDLASEVASLSVDKDRLYQALQALYPTNGSGSLTNALGRANQVFSQTSSGLNREVYILSDFHANTLKDQQALRDAAGGLPRDSTVFLCPVPASVPENNTSVLAVSIDPRPKVAGRVMRLVATVKNNSVREITTNISAGLHDVKPQSAAVTLVAGATQEVPLTLTLGQEGFIWGEVRLDNDDAPYDNVWPFCLEVRGPIRALVIAPMPVNPRHPEQAEAFYLLKALDPTGDGRLSGIHVEHVAPQNMPKDLAAYDAVILCGGHVVPPASIKALETYVERGGGLMVFSTSRDAALAAGHPLQSLLGGKITGELSAIGTQKPFSLQVVRPASQYFDDCRGADGGVEFSEVAVVHALKVEPGPNTDVLAQFFGGHPAILEQKRKLGRVMWWTLSAHADDSNLPLVPQFLSLLHRSVSVFAGAQSMSLSQQAGNPLIFDLSVRWRKDAKPVYPPAVTIFDPTEKTYEVPVEGGRVTWRQTGRVGVYRMAPKAGDKKTAAPPAFSIPPGFALTPDPDERMQEYRRADEVKAALGLAGALIVDPGMDLLATVNITRQGRELFGYFIFAALLAILAEVILANMLGVRMKTPQAPLVGTAPSRAAPAPGLTLAEPARKPAEAPASSTERTAGGVAP